MSTEIPFNEIYPNIVSDTQNGEVTAINGHETESTNPASMSRNYRLNEISDWKKFLESEIESRNTTAAKYKRCLKIAKGLEITGGIISVGLTATTAVVAAIGTAGALAPVVPAAIGGSIAGVSVASKAIDSRLGRKKKKHELIAQAASTTLDLTTEKMSKILEDGFVTAEEFSEVKKVIDTYKNTKEKIREASQKKAKEDPDLLKVTAADIQKYINQGRSEERAATQKKFLEALNGPTVVVSS